MSYLILVHTEGQGAAPAGSVQLSGGDFDSGISNNNQITFLSDGRINWGFLPETYIDPWWSLAPEVGIGSSYEIFATQPGGFPPPFPVTNAALNTWISLASDVTWQMTTGGEVGESAPIDIIIRDTATQTTQATATYTISTGGGSGGGFPG